MVLKVKRDRGRFRPLLILLSFLALLFVASYLAGRAGLFDQGSVIQFSSEKIAVVYVEGVLEDSRGVLESLEQYADRDDVLAIVVRIDCPGGAVGSAQEIYGEIRKLREDKVLLASLGNLAASGGYYVASAAQEIVANAGTLTGSIGVISEYPNFQELMKKIGYRSEVLKGGRYKDIGNPMREMTPEEVGILQGLIDNIHNQFIRDVASGRNQDVEQVRKLADGRIFTGEQAKDLGLVDRLGNLQDALDRAAELAGIEGKPTVLYPEQKKPRIWDVFFQGLADRFVEGIQRAYLTP